MKMKIKAKPQRVSANENENKCEEQLEHACRSSKVLPWIVIVVSCIMPHKIDTTMQPANKQLATETSNHQLAASN